MLCWYHFSLPKAGRWLRKRRARLDMWPVTIALGKVFGMLSRRFLGKGQVIKADETDNFSQH